MEPDIIAVRGDGVGATFFRDGSGTARITIVADCRTSQSTTLTRPTFEVSTSRPLTSVTVELAGQAVTAARTPTGAGIAAFSASIDISGVAGALSRQVVARRRETQSRTFFGPGNSTTQTHNSTTPRS